MFASHSMRYALLKAEDLLGKSLQTLFLSGPAGVGKTTLSRQRLRQVKDLRVAWIKPTCETREQLLAQVLEDIGPGPVEGTPNELRHIAEVFLRHQVGNGRFAFIVADGLERFAAPVLRELEAARLIVSSGKAVVAEVTLNRPRMVLGRDDSCDISLYSRYVSRFQNLFLETADGWMLIDLSSTNGCFVNGRRVREHRLRDGDLIAVGHHQMRFAGPSGKARPASPAQADDEGDTTVVSARLDVPQRKTSH